LCKLTLKVLLLNPGSEDPEDPIKDDKQVLYPKKEDQANKENHKVTKEVRDPKANRSVVDFEKLIERKFPVTPNYEM